MPGASPEDTDQTALGQGGMDAEFLNPAPTPNLTVGFRSQVSVVFLVLLEFLPPRLRCSAQREAVKRWPGRVSPDPAASHPRPGSLILPSVAHAANGAPPQPPRALGERSHGAPPWGPPSPSDLGRPRGEPRESRLCQPRLCPLPEAVLPGQDVATASVVAPPPK